MTPAERLALLVLLDEYLHPERRDTDPCAYGPYGRTERRTGLPASRIGQIEHDLVGWPEDFNLPVRAYTRLLVQGICDVTHTPYPDAVIERTP